MNKNYLLSLTLLVLLLTTFSFTSLASWEYPTLDPTYGNQVAPPVNVGPAPQTKHGSLEIINGGMVVDSNMLGSNIYWPTPATYNMSFDTDGPIGINGSISSDDIIGKGYLSKALISTEPTIPSERPLCAMKSNGKIVPCPTDPIASDPNPINTDTQ